MVHIDINIVDGNEAAKIAAQTTGGQNHSRSLIVSSAGEGSSSPETRII
jgi:hypothetical protein